MSRRKRRRAAARPPARGLLGAWTIQRATVAGLLSGLAAIVTVSLFNLNPDGLLYPYAAMLALTALCGASILWITVFDMRERGTSGRMRPIRGFDVAVGLGLAVPSLYGLSMVWDALEL